MCPTAIGLGTACATVGVGCNAEVELGISNRLRGRWRWGEEAGSFWLFWGELDQHENEVISYVPQEIRPYFFRVGKVVLAMCTKDRANYVYTHYMHKYMHLLCFFQELYVGQEVFLFWCYLHQCCHRFLSEGAAAVEDETFHRFVEANWQEESGWMGAGWEFTEVMGSRHIHKSAADEDWDLVLTRVTCSAKPNRDKDVMMRCRGSFWSHRPVR